MTAQSVPSNPLRAPGYWLAVAIALLQAFNAVRAFTDPAGFAAYLGLPLDAGGDAGWVFIYGLRTAFIALAVAALLFTRNMAALTWIAAAGIVMPVGDAVLAQSAGAPAATVARHAAIAVYLAVTCAALVAWTRRRSPS